MPGTLVVKKPRAPISKPVDPSKVRTMPLPVATDQQPPERVSVAVRGSDGHEFRAHFDPLEPSQREIDRLLAMDAAIAEAGGSEVQELIADALAATAKYEYAMTILQGRARYAKERELAGEASRLGRLES